MGIISHVPKARKSNISSTLSCSLQVAVYKDFVYWMDRENNAIYRANKYTGADIVPVVHGIAKEKKGFGLKIVAPEMQVCKCIICFISQILKCTKNTLNLNTSTQTTKVSKLERKLPILYIL